VVPAVVVVEATVVVVVGAAVVLVVVVGVLPAKLMGIITCSEVARLLRSLPT
jgi:hypothetical protein